MKKVLIAVFAHPDDESFGPGGTLAKLSKKYEIHTVCVTGGGAGQNARTKSTRNLADIRRDEYRDAAKILGVTKTHCFGFQDGTLSNSLYHIIAEKIDHLVIKLKPEMLMTFEPKGVSGHIDHIAVSMITTFVFKKNPRIKKLMYYCIRDTRREKYLDNYFIYFPEGYNIKNIDEEVDVSSTFETKIQAIMAHKSQKDDGDRIIKSLKKLGPKEYFLIKNQ